MASKSVCNTATVVVSPATSSPSPVKLQKTQKRTLMTLSQQIKRDIHMEQWRTQEFCLGGGGQQIFLWQHLQHFIWKHAYNVQEMTVLFPDGQWRTQEFFSGGGSTNSVEDRGQRERGSGGGNPLVRGSGGSCNLVQEISFHIVKFS